MPHPKPLPSLRPANLQPAAEAVEVGRLILKAAEWSPQSHELTRVLPDGGTLGVALRPQQQLAEQAQRRPPDWVAYTDGSEDLGKAGWAYAVSRLYLIFHAV